MLAVSSGLEGNLPEFVSRLVFTACTGQEVDGTLEHWNSGSDEDPLPAVHVYSEITWIVLVTCKLVFSCSVVGRLKISHNYRRNVLIESCFSEISLA